MVLSGIQGGQSVVRAGQIFCRYFSLVLLHGLSFLSLSRVDLCFRLFTTLDYWE